MFYAQCIQYCWHANDPIFLEILEEFWGEVFRAHERARLGISRGNSSNQQWRRAKRMLSRHGWADMSYFHEKQNDLYEAILEAIQDNVISMRSDSDIQFNNCMWMMEDDPRDHLTFDMQFPHRALKIFVLLPSPAKAERYLLDNSAGRGGLYFLGIHFPTVFPMVGTWANASPDACRFLKQHFRHEIVNNVDEIRRVAFASPDSISDEEMEQAINCIGQERRDRLSKIYFWMFRESGAWGDYLNYLRDKGLWID
jgi:hypothetical protein